MNERRIRTFRILREIGVVECDHCRGSGSLPNPTAWRGLRKQLGLTLKEVSEDGLFSVAYLSELERGRKPMTWQHANDLADIYSRLAPYTHPAFGWPALLPEAPVCREDQRDTAREARTAMSKTQLLRGRLKELEWGDRDRRVTNEQVSEWAAEFGLSVEYTGLVVRGAGIHIGEGRFPDWRRP